MAEGLNLVRALRLEPGAVISLVGGGGKTSAMFCIAAELSSCGYTVVSTTTTHIANDQVQLVPAHLSSTELQRLDSVLAEERSCLIVGDSDGRGRVNGIPPQLVDELITRPSVDFVVVEADGSRSLPFKAPADYEPVVPSSTTHLVPVMGLDVLGRPLDDRNVHRADRISQLSGAPPGSPITPEIAACVLSDPNGGAKSRPVQARLVVLLNKADVVKKADAETLAELLLARPNVDEVIISSVKTAPPVIEVRTRIAGIVLAAGQARRFGATKQILPWGDTTLVGRAAHIALESGLKPVVVVVGYDADHVRAALAGLPVTVVFNPDFAEGQSTSIRQGLAALTARIGGAVFLLADSPTVSSSTVRSIIDAHRRSLAPIVVPTCGNVRGNPVLFDVSVFPELHNLTGDTGGRQLFNKYEQRLALVCVDEPGILQDIDTPDEYERAARQNGKAGAGPP